MDYLLSREFDEQFPAMGAVSRSVVVLPVSLWQNEALRRHNVSFDFRWIAQLSC